MFYLQYWFWWICFWCLFKLLILSELSNQTIDANILKWKWRCEQRNKWFGIGRFDKSDVTYTIQKIGMDWRFVFLCEYWRFGSIWNFSWNGNLMLDRNVKLFSVYFTSLDNSNQITSLDLIFIQHFGRHKIPNDSNDDVGGHDDISKENCFLRNKLRHVMIRNK